MTPDTTDDAPTTRCGGVALIGAPNAGKSTLTNALVGQKVAIVSAKPQTTRARLTGIAIEGDAQILLVDTPGVFEPRRRLDSAMVRAAWDGGDEADLVCWVVDAGAADGVRGQEDIDRMVHRLRNAVQSLWVVLNKVDATPKEPLLSLAQSLGERVPVADTFFLSATTGDGVPQFKRALAQAMPEGAWRFPADQLVDASERLLATEITREQLYTQLHAELPYAAAVVTERWEERPNGSVEIHQQIRVERSSQRAIVLGGGGLRIKSIGATARAAIGELLGRKVHLYLHVKVDAHWAEDRSLYDDLGLDWR